MDTNPMKPFIFLLIIVLGLSVSSCGKPESDNKLHFSTSAEYPPFEYNDHGEIKGFDIELAQLIAKELGKEAVFDNMQFSTVLAAVTSGQDDVAISTITVTDERKNNVDFTDPYYFEGMATVYLVNQPLTKPSQLNGKKIAVQLGTVMELWLREHYPSVKVIAFDNNPQAVEALLAGHVDAVLIDGFQGSVFSKKHSGISYSIIANANKGYALALKKGSPLTAKINLVLQKLKASGALKKLEDKWLEMDL